MDVELELGLGFSFGFVLFCCKKNRLHILFHLQGMRPVAWGSLFHLVCIGIYLQMLWNLLSVDLQLKWTQYCIHWCVHSWVEVNLPETRAMLIFSKPQSASILQHNFALCSAICEVHPGRQLMTPEIQVQTSVFMTHMSLPSSFH